MRSTETHNEKLSNVRDMLVDKKIYQFFIDLFNNDKTIFAFNTFAMTTMLLDNELLPLAFYYMYPVEYCIRPDGAREITVSYIDWRQKIYAQCEYLFYIYPRKTGSREYTNNLRVEFIVRHITAKFSPTNTNRAQRIVHAIGDQLIQWFFDLLDKNDREIEAKCLLETGVLVSRRLVDFLKYMCQIHVCVKSYLRENCQCGGNNDVCVCVALCASVRRLYDVHKLCGDAVLCETKK
jgi:hypothetical protein